MGLKMWMEIADYTITYNYDIATSNGGTFEIYNNTTATSLFYVNPSSPQSGNGTVTANPNDSMTITIYGTDFFATSVYAAIYDGGFNLLADGSGTTDASATYNFSITSNITIIASVQAL